MGEEYWRYLETDREFFESELASFVPDRVFDAHAHLYDRRHLGDDFGTHVARGPERVGMETYVSYIAQITPNRQKSGLFFAYPSSHIDFAAANDFLIGQVKQHPASRGAMLVHPRMDPEFIRETVRREGFAGLKCYHFFASDSRLVEATIPSYLPEEHVRVAHEEGLSITLHIVRSRALADPVNQMDIRRYAERYPNARFILAHTARGFNPSHTIGGIRALQGLRNIWCDTAAVCECGGIEAVVRTLGADRLLYGSDFPDSHLRSRCVAVGDSFFWLSCDNTNFSANYAEVRPTLVGLEALRALKIACLNLDLSDTQVENTFYGNAAKLFELEG